MLGAKCFTFHSRMTAIHHSSYVRSLVNPSVEHFEQRSAKATDTNSIRVVEEVEKDDSVDGVVVAFADTATLLEL